LKSAAIQLPPKIGVAQACIGNAKGACLNVSINDLVKIAIALKA
jgi:hypothetical protein